MAGDWVKWEHGFAEKPEVATTADILGVSLAEAVLLWMHFFEWADKNTTNGDVPGITPSRIDMIVRHAGFARAGQQAGWMTFDAKGLILPNFLRHNGKSAKRRALDAERKRAGRASA
jgi:hypothetical protein